MLSLDNNLLETAVPTYTRQQLADLTDVPFSRIVSWQRRAQLPVSHGLDNADFDDLAERERGGRSWTRYEVIDVLLVAVFARLQDQLVVEGLGPNGALVLTVGVRGSIQSTARSRVVGDRWAGYVSFNEGGFCVEAAPYPELIDSIWRRRADEEAPTRVILINVSLVIREVAERAKKLGIPFDPRSA